jgi:uncharacterized protein with HEPN domain
MTESELIPSVRDRFVHILSAVDTVETEFSEISVAELTSNRASCLALERLLEIIGVASDHIPAEIKASETMVDWQCLSDISLRLENVRERVEPRVLMSVVKEKLTPLKDCAERRIQA